jgi:hypothetical protein
VRCRAPTAQVLLLAARFEQKKALLALLIF